MFAFRINDFRNTYTKALMAFNYNLSDCKTTLIINKTCCVLRIDNYDKGSYFHQFIKPDDFSGLLDVDISLTDEILAFFNSTDDFNYAIVIDKMNNNIVIEIPCLEKSMTINCKYCIPRYDILTVGLLGKINTLDRESTRVNKLSFNSNDEFFGTIRPKYVFKAIDKAMRKLSNVIKHFGSDHKFVDNKYYLTYKGVELEISLHLEIFLFNEEIYFEFVYRIKILSEYDRNSFYDDNRIIKSLIDKKINYFVKYDSDGDYHTFTIINNSWIKSRETFSSYYHKTESRMYIPYNLLKMLIMKKDTQRDYSFIFMLSEDKELRIFHYSREFGYIAPNIKC